MANSFLTREDEDNYGRDLLDVSQRAALHALAPHLQQTQAQMNMLAQENADLRARQAQEQRRRLDQQVAAAVPDYREIDRDPAWHRWLLGTDLMSGRLRQQLLNEGIASGNAGQVKAVFDGFRRQGGQSASASAPPRRGASDKPFYTHQRIKELYEQHRKGAYTGREAEWNRIEHDIFAAQREGRVEFVPYLTK
jgi:hypothetical protein